MIFTIVSWHVQLHLQKDDQIFNQNLAKIWHF